MSKQSAVPALIRTAIVATSILLAGPGHAADGETCGAAVPHQEEGRPDQAVAAWRACLERGDAVAVPPAHAHFAIGVLQLQMNQIAYAIDSFGAAIEADPGYGAAYLERAVAFRRAGMKQESLDDAGRAFDNADDDALRARALTHRGDDYARLNLFGPALADLDRSIALNETAPAYLSRAGVYRSMGRVDEAIADLGAAVRLDPEMRAAYRERAELSALTGGHAQAVRDAEQNVRLDSRDPEGHAFRCRLLNSLALADIGLESCHTAIRLDPQADRYQFEHAFARWQVGDDAGVRMALGMTVSDVARTAGEELIANFPRLLAERLLASLGYPLMEVDGAVDASTIAALSEFEGEHGAPADPALDAATVAHLKGVLHAAIPYIPGSNELMPPEPVLEVMSGPAKGRHITLWDIPMTLGRVGGQMARIDAAEGGFVIGLAEGQPVPTLNGDTVADTPAPIADGDLLGIFGIEIAFRQP